MTRFDEMIDKLQGSAVYSTFVFADAFSQIPIDSDDTHETVFHARIRKIEYTCIPFGLMYAPVELQLKVDHDFGCLIDERWMIIYVNAMIVCCRTVQEQLQPLKEALQLLRQKQ